MHIRLLHSNCHVCTMKAEAMGVEAAMRNLQGKVILVCGGATGIWQIGFCGGLRLNRFRLAMER